MSLVLPAPSVSPSPAPPNTHTPQDGPGGSQVHLVPVFERVGWVGWATAGWTACGENSMKNNRLSGCPQDHFTRILLTRGTHDKSGDSTLSPVDGGGSGGEG